MRVVIETTALSRPGGTRGLGRYTAACVTAFQGMDAVDAVSLSTPALGNPRAAEFLEYAHRSARLARLRPDVFFATNPYVVAATCSPRVSSILDVIPLDLDSHRKTGIKAQVFFRLAARADSIVTISEFSADRIAVTLGVPRDRIFVAPLPAVGAFIPADEPVADDSPPFALALLDMATPDPRKRAFLLPEIARRLQDHGVELRVAGAGTLDHLRGAANITPLGRVSDADLAILYRQCSSFVYFSAYEGQGLPPLEAMTAGAPVVAFSNSAVTEVVGDGGVLIEEPGGAWRAQMDWTSALARPVEELVDAVVQLAHDAALRHEWRERGRVRAQSFSPERFVGSIGRAVRAAT